MTLEDQMIADRLKEIGDMIASECKISKQKFIDILDRIIRGDEIFEKPEEPIEFDGLNMCPHCDHICDHSECYHSKEDLIDDIDYQSDYITHIMLNE